MPERFTKRLMGLIKRPTYQPLKERELARALRVPDDQYPLFRQTVRDLTDQGDIVIGPGKRIMLPPMPNRIEGVFRQSRHGFGFVVPEKPCAEGDLYIPYGETLDAVSGDRVSAKIVTKDHRAGQSRLRGRIIEILDRGEEQFVGTLTHEDDQWFVQPDGKVITELISVDDPAAKNAKPGDKVLVELISYPTPDYYAHGVIIEKLGRAGAPSTELKGIIRRYNLPEKFSRKAINQTRHAVRQFAPEKTIKSKKREDIRDKIIITIDPVDARDFDDAISIERDPNGSWILGVHIADVASFVTENSQLDTEARERGNSVYLPDKVLPMLPELLSNGVCSLQQGRDRLAKSAYIKLDNNGKVLGTRFANSLIRSTQRLTYEDAERILAGNTVGFDKTVLKLLRDMDKLARILQKRRVDAGMLSLELPQAELVYNARGEVVDARPESTSFPHTIIEMFMLEANEAVARLLDGINVPFLRRIHPEPDSLASDEATRIIKLYGYNIPKQINRKGLQQLLASVSGKPQSFIVNLAVLKSLQRAEYSPVHMGHYALASEHYAHFTSPIRRYPDLTIHRLLQAYLDGKLTPDTVDNFPDFESLETLGTHCSDTERNAEKAEDELRTVKILQLLEKHIGEEMNAVVVSITNFGMFVQCERFLIEGLIKAEDVLRAGSKKSSGKRSKKGKQHRSSRPRGKFLDTCPYILGQELRVKIVDVNVPARLLDLTPAD